MNTNFDTFFRRVRTALGIGTQGELARLLGVNRSAITQAKQRDSVPGNWLVTLVQDHGLDASWLLGEGDVGGVAECVQAPRAERGAAPRPNVESERFFAVPKVRARLCAGGGSFEVGSDVEGYYAFTRSWLSRKGSPEGMVLMDVFGTSMEPEIKEGDSVLVDQSGQEIVAGRIYAMGVEDTVMVKRVEKRPGALALLSDNPDYSPIILREAELATVRVIGKVVWVCREYR